MRVELARQPKEVYAVAAGVVLLWSWGSPAWAGLDAGMALESQWASSNHAFSVPVSQIPSVVVQPLQFPHLMTLDKATIVTPPAQSNSSPVLHNPQQNLWTNPELAPNSALNLEISRNLIQVTDQAQPNDKSPTQAIPQATIQSAAVPLSPISRPEVVYTTPSSAQDLKNRADLLDFMPTRSTLAINSPKSIAEPSRLGASYLQPITIASANSKQSPADRLNLEPSIIDNSPVLQRWLKKVPDVADEISNRPSFRTRLRIGYAQFPSTNQLSGWGVGIEDLWLFSGNTTFSALYQTSFDNTRQTWGFDLNYYLRPVGRYFNVAPIVGYRDINTPLYAAEGLNLGLRFLVVLSRGGGADLVLTQSWTAPGTDQEIGLTTFSIGYALTSKLRLATEIQRQSAPQRRDSRFGILLEWLL